MKKHLMMKNAIVSLAVFGVLGVCLTTAAEEKALTSMHAERIFVHGMKKLDKMSGGTSVDWSGENGRLLISKPGASRYFNVYSVTPQGFRNRSLTLGRQWSTSVQHKGDASWGPAGKFFVFVVQNRGSSSYGASMPGVGLNCNVWVGSREAERPWQLTDISTTNPPKDGVLAPHFSPDGTRLLWCGVSVLQVAGARTGTRKMYLGDINLQEGRKVAVSNIQVLKPGAQKDYYNPHGFSPDGNRILFSGNLEKNATRLGMDLYTFDLRTSKIVNLTQTTEAWDDFASYSPDGKKIAFASSQGLNLRFFGGGDSKWRENLKTELWVMNADGTEPKQLTFFHTFGAPEHYRRRTFVSDCAWGPDGKTIAICLSKETGHRDLTADVILVELGLDAPANGPKVEWAKKKQAGRVGYGKPKPPVR